MEIFSSGVVAARWAFSAVKYSWDALIGMVLLSRRDLIRFCLGGLCPESWNNP